MSLQSEPIEDTEIVGTYVANAGKEYACSAGCGKPILKGEKYTRISFKKAGKFYCEHFHFACGE